MCWQICACLCPPLTVCAKKGCCTAEFFAAFFLTCLGYIPGCLYACMVVSQEEPRSINVTQKTVVHAAPAAPAAPQNFVINVTGGGDQRPLQCQPQAAQAGYYIPSSGPGPEHQAQLHHHQTIQMPMTMPMPVPGASAAGAPPPYSPTAPCDTK